MRRAALKFRNVGLSRALTTWAVWGAQRALYKQNAFLLASHHAGVVSQAFTPRNSSYSHRAIPRIHTAQFLVFTPRLCVVSQLVLVAWREAVKSNHRLRDNVVESLRLTRSKHALRHLRLGIEASKEQGRKALRLMASGELRSIRAALVKWMEIISEADAAREKMWGAVGRMRNTKLAAGFLGWLGAVEAIATAKALMALCVRTFINKVLLLLLPGQTYESPPPLSTLSPPPIPTGDRLRVALVDGIRRRLPPDAQVRALVHAPRVSGVGARVGSDG